MSLTSCGRQFCEVSSLEVPPIEPICRWGGPVGGVGRGDGSIGWVFGVRWGRRCLDWVGRLGAFIEAMS